MKLVNNEIYVIPSDKERLVDLPEKVNERLRALSKVINLIDMSNMFEANKNKVFVGDVFVIHVQRHSYVYGKVISNTVDISNKLDNSKSDFIILLYKASSKEAELPTMELDYNNLLVRPMLVHKFFFESGFAKVLGNIPLSKEEKDLDIGFVEGSKSTIVEYSDEEFNKLLESGLTEEKMKNFLDSKKRVESELNYYDKLGNLTKDIPKYLGYTKIYGRELYDIARELIIDPSVIGEEFKLPVKKKKVYKKTKEATKIKMITEIVENMISYQKDCENYKDRMDKEIDLFENVSNKFYQDSRKAKNEKKYLKCVKEYVIHLNNLNEDNDFELIETDEREQIYSFIDWNSKELGFNFDYDITEDYREW